MPFQLAPIRPKRLPRLILLLVSGVVFFVFLTPYSLDLFGPPPGLSLVRDALGYEPQAPFPSQSKSAKKQQQRKPNLVYDLGHFKPEHRSAAKVVKPAATPKAGAPQEKGTLDQVQSRCPDPFKPAPRSLNVKDFDMTLCEDIQSSHPDFKVSACPAPSYPTCNAFFLVVERKDLDACDAAYKEPVSSNKKDAALVKSSSGPDTFQVLVTGSERYSVSKHIGYDNLEAPCRYIYPVTLSNTGDFSLQILHLYELWHGQADYMAIEPGAKMYYGPKDTVDAEGKHTPPLPRIIQDPLFEDEQGFSSAKLPKGILCPKTCPRYSFTANPQNSPTGSLRVLSDSKARYDALPLCSRLEPIAGAYFPDPTPVQNKSLPIVPFRWHPLGCRLSQSNVKMLDGEKGLAARKQCLGTTRRRVVFQGDSHTRMSYDALMPRLRDLGDELPIYGKAKMKENTFYKTDFIFVWDSHFIRLMREPTVPQNADILVLSLGAHQARNRWTTNTFRRLLERITAHLSQWTSTKMLFLTVPAKQLYNGDWRTHPRIQAWSDLTIEQTRAAGLGEINFIEGFESTLPFMNESPDGIHFRDLPAQEAWLLQIVHKMDLCGVND